MGTISDKLTYLNDTKQLLKENINNLGGNLTTEPFRQYASVLEGIYERLPKVSGIGTSLSLSPSLMGKIKLNEIQGNTLQNGTPTPSSPIPIECVTGNQNATICGKNMFKDGTTFIPQSVAWFDQNGNIVNSVSQIQTNNNYIDLEANKTYTFSVKEKTNVSQAQCVYIENNDLALLSNIYLDQVSTTITPTKDMRVWIRIRNNENATNTLFVGQFEQGSATTYEAYNGTTYNVNLGKNLINYNSTGSGKAIDFTFSGSELTLNGTTNGSGEITTTSTQPITLKPGTYTFSSTKTGSFTANSKSVAIYLRKLSDSSRIVELNQVNSYTLESSFTLTEETKVYVQIYTNGAGFVFDNLKIQWQMERGSQASSYSPYFTPYELNKIGDYKDYIFKNEPSNPLYDDTLTLNSWYLCKEFGKRIFNGTESDWELDSTEKLCGLALNELKQFSSTHILEGVSNRYIPYTLANARLNTNGFCSNVEKLWFNNNSMSLNNFKTWLGTNNIEVIFPLKTPTTTEITNTELIEQLESLYNAKSKDGTTNINVTSEDLSMILNVGVLKGE